jgi:hypothetical protein
MCGKKLIALLRIAAVAGLICAAPSIQAGTLIAVLNLETDGTVSDATNDTICDRISDEIAVDNRYEVFNRKFLPFTLQSVGLAERPACSNVRCLADIGNRIATNRIIGGSIRTVKNEVVITLMYVDAESQTVLGSMTQKIPVTKKGLLRDKLPLLAKSLISIEKSPGESGKTRAKAVETTPSTATRTVVVMPKKPAEMRESPTASTEIPAEVEETPAPSTKMPATVKKPRIAKTKTPVLIDEPRPEKEKPRATPFEPRIVRIEKRKRPAIPIAIIGGTALVAGAAAAVVYFKFLGGPADDATDPDLSLGDAPKHVP